MNIKDILLIYKKMLYNKKFTKQNRFQNQPWYIKLWRLKWYLLIPYWSLCLTYTKVSEFYNCWKIATGIAQAKMNWLYDFKDVKRKNKNV